MNYYNQINIFINKNKQINQNTHNMQYIYIYIYRKPPKEPIGNSPNVKKNHGSNQIHTFTWDQMLPSTKGLTSTSTYICLNVFKVAPHAPNI